MSGVTKCSCSNCSYNQDDSCQADNIEVSSTEGTSAIQAEGTRCSTFKPRNDNRGNIYTEM